MGRWGFIWWISLISCLFGVQKFQNILKTKTEKNSWSRGREEGQRAHLDRWALKYDEGTGLWKLRGEA